MDTIVVKFKNPFRVPGFGRKRFPGGLVHDVPASMRDHLPSTAVILTPEDVETEEQAVAQREELAIQDLARAAGDTSQEALERAGLAGAVDASGETKVAEKAGDKPSRTKGKVKK